MMSLLSIRSLLAAFSILMISSATSIADEKPIPVNASNFVREETDRYFSNAAKEGAFGTLRHRREAIAIDHQDVIRINRDTLYSHGVFDLDSARLTVTLPEPGKRFMLLQVISQDHYTMEVVYAPGRYEYSKEKAETRYV